MYDIFCGGITGMMANKDERRVCVWRYRISAPLSQDFFDGIQKN